MSISSSINGASESTLQEIRDKYASDSFSRIMVADPTTIFSGTFQYDTNVWSTTRYGDWEEIHNNGTYTHLPNESSVQLSIGTTSGHYAYRQQHLRNRYQPGKAQQIIQTWLPIVKSNVRCRNGYFDPNDGVFLEVQNTQASFVLRTSTGGSPSDSNSVNQSSWNYDKFDGTGESGITIDFSKALLQFFDLEWLSLGIVVCGFYFNGKPRIAHIFNTGGNALTAPYMKTANLPLRIEIQNVGTSASSSAIKQICNAVISSGGFELDRGIKSYVGNGITAIPVDTTFRPILSFRPAQQINSINNAGYLEVIDVMVMCTTNDCEWKLILNPTLTGGSAASWVTQTGKMVEYDVTQTGNTVAITNGTNEGGGYALAGGGGSSAAVTHNEPTARLLLGRNWDYSTTDMITVAARSVTGTSNVKAIINCREYW